LGCSYSPGELKAVSYKAGLVNGTDIVKTSGKAAGIIANADRKNVVAKENHYLCYYFCC